MDTKPPPGREAVAAWRARQRRRQRGAIVLVILALVIAGIGRMTGTLVGLFGLGAVALVLFVCGLYLGIEELPPGW